MIEDPQATTGAGLVLEFAELGSLRQILTAETDEMRTLRNARTRLVLARDIAEAMRFLHTLKPRAVIHRDLKSPNCESPPSVFVNRPFLTGAHPQFRRSGRAQ